MSIFKPNNQVARPLGSKLAGLGMAAYGNQDPDPDVKRYQSMMNEDLNRLGFTPIGVDGKLGKATCGVSHLFDTTAAMFNTARSDWDDNLAFQVNQACDGQAFTVPYYKNKPAYVQDPKDASCGTQALPWGAASALASGIQATLNTQLTANGYNPIAVTGALDAATCGALRTVDKIAGTGYECLYGTKCGAFTDPTKKPGAVTPTGPTPSGPAVVVPASGVSKASMLTGGLILGAVGLAYYFAKKKGMV